MFNVLLSFGVLLGVLNLANAQSGVAWEIQIPGLVNIKKMNPAQPSAPVVSCANLLKAVDPDVTWRAADTNSILAGGGKASTSPAREAEMIARKQDMLDEIHGVGKYQGHNDVPEMTIFPAVGTSFSKVLVAPQRYGSGVIRRFEVSGVGPTGKMKMTIACPVSGHVGLENAKKWAKTDKYFIGLQDLSGGIKDPPMTKIVDGEQSRDMVTFQEVEVQLKIGEPMRVLYWRDGSGGPWGYIEGRAWEFVWDGT